MLDVIPCGCCKNRHFAETCRLHHQGDKDHSVFRLLVTANVPSYPIHAILIIEVLRSSETSVITITTRHYSPEDDILQSRRCEMLKSYKVYLLKKYYESCI
jgi:hypothetical protein